MKFFKNARKWIVNNFWLIAFIMFVGLNYGQHARLENKLTLWEQKMGFDRADGWVNVVASYFGTGDGLEKAVMYSGTRVNDKSLFYASRSVPMGTKALFYNPKTHKYATGICLDWGPNARLKRDVDLGPALAKELGFKGVYAIKMKVI
jgi:rare lipoprotein A (peptidoglycan hydrolase)